MKTGALLTEPAVMPVPGVLGQPTATSLKAGIVYTETVVHSAPEQFAAEAPYQLAIVTLDEGGRLTVRIEGARVQIGDKVELAGERNGIPFYRRVE